MVDALVILMFESPCFISDRISLVDKFQSV